MELSPTRSATGFNYSINTFVNGSHRDIDTSIGVFGQYRHAINPSTAIGIHLAYRQDDSVYRDYQINRSVNFTVSADNAYEVLGFVARHGKAVNPFVMLGVRQVETESLLSGMVSITPVQQSSEDDLTGWTFAAGVEMPLAQNWFAQMAVQYTDYGEEIETTQTGGGLTVPTSIDFDLQQTGLRFALGYAF